MEKLDRETEEAFKHLTWCHMHGTILGIDDKAIDIQLEATDNQATSPCGTWNGTLSPRSRPAHFDKGGGKPWKGNPFEIVRSR
jgi:hypothetical protein